MNSYLKYTKSFKKLNANRAGRQLLLQEIRKVKGLRKRAQSVSISDKKNALQEIAQWFSHNQSKMADDGFGTYYLAFGWTSSYPETTGYIIPTLLEYAEFSNNPTFVEISKKALDWLLSIQKPNGGWQSGYIHQNKDAVVFNTGQILRGLTAGYKKFNDQNYLNAAVKACEWLVSIQNTDGGFDEHVYLNKARVYDSYVVAPMLEVYALCKNEPFKKAAIKNINWIIENKQLENGWFEDCDNTIHKNSKPILHTISYTIDGILDCALFLNNDAFLASAKKPADILLNKFLKDKALKGRFDKNWNGSEQILTTGYAQISIIWQKLFKKTGEHKYKEAYETINSHLVVMQKRDIIENENTKGAIFGSFPLWGRYESFGCPNWANKYMMDSLLFEISQ